MAAIYHFALKTVCVDMYITPMFVKIVLSHRDSDNENNATFWCYFYKDDWVFWLGKLHRCNKNYTKQRCFSKIRIDRQFKKD